MIGAYFLAGVLIGMVVLLASWIGQALTHRQPVSRQIFFITLAVLCGVLVGTGLNFLVFKLLLGYQSLLLQGTVIDLLNQGALLLIVAICYHTIFHVGQRLTRLSRPDLSGLSVLLGVIAGFALYMLGDLILRSFGYAEYLSPSSPFPFMIGVLAGMFVFVLLLRLIITVWRRSCAPTP